MPVWEADDVLSLDEVATALRDLTAEPCGR